MSKKMSTETNAINWFEIAASDINRATTFYETIFEIKTVPMEMMGMKMAIFPYDDTKGAIGGAIVQSQMHKPGAGGVTIYLNANPDLGLVEKRIEKAGGKIIMSKMLIDENTGYMALFIDSEGNTIGIHSTN